MSSAETAALRKILQKVQEEKRVLEEECSVLIDISLRKHWKNISEMRTAATNPRKRKETSSVKVAQEKIARVSMPYGSSMSAYDPAGKSYGSSSNGSSVSSNKFSLPSSSMTLSPSFHSSSANANS